MISKLQFLKYIDSPFIKTPVKPSIISISFGFFFLSLVFALPTRITAWFDGLPWTNDIETIILVAIVPFLLILGYRFILIRGSIIFLAGLLILKLILFFGSPSSGWQIKITPNLTKEVLVNFLQFQRFDVDEKHSKMDPEIYKFQASERDIWIKSFMSKDDFWVKTYTTFWNNNVSGILQEPWTEKINFPLDWVMIGKGWTQLGVPHESLNVQCPVSTTCLEDLRPIIDVKGALLIPEEKRFAVIAEGAQEGTFTAINENGQSLVVAFAKSFEEVTQEKYQLPKGGKWEISAKILYEGKEWSLIPILIGTNGKITKAMGRDVIWQNEEDLSKSQNLIGFYKTLSLILDVGIIIFLFIWTTWVVCLLINQRIFNLNFSIFCFFMVCSPFLMVPLIHKLLKIVGLADATTVSYLGFSILFVFISFIIFIYWKKDYQNFQSDKIVRSIFLFLVPATLIFFTNKWWYLLGQIQVWSPGDDWAKKQYYAYKIIVEEDWLRGGEGYFLMQPFYRYLVGFYHMLFGQSNFAQHMADVWCVLIASILLAKLMLKFRCSSFIIFVSCITYLSINLIGSFRYQLGKSLAENHAMVFMMLAAWFLILAREGGTHKLILAAIFGSIGFWIRMDHLLVIAGFGLLIFEPVEGPRGWWKEYWNRFKMNWTQLSWYWGGGILSIFLLCFRNWWLGGDFTPYQSGPAYGLQTTYSFEYESLYVLFSAQSWSSFPSIGISGFILISGMLIALLALVWHSKIFFNFPLSLSISMLGLVLPFFIFKNLGYAPRWSIHLLPLAIFSVSFLLNNIVEKYRVLKLNFYNELS